MPYKQNSKVRSLSGEQWQAAQKSETFNLVKHSPIPWKGQVDKTISNIWKSRRKSQPGATTRKVFLASYSVIVLEISTQVSNRYLAAGRGICSGYSSVWDALPGWRCGETGGLSVSQAPAAGIEEPKPSVRPGGILQIHIQCSISLGMPAALDRHMSFYLFIFLLQR